MRKVTFIEPLIETFKADELVVETAFTGDRNSKE